MKVFIVPGGSQSLVPKSFFKPSTWRLFSASATLTDLSRVDRGRPGQTGKVKCRKLQETTWQSGAKYRDTR